MISPVGTENELLWSVSSCHGLLRVGVSPWYAGIDKEGGLVNSLPVAYGNFHISKKLALWSGILGNLQVFFVEAI